MKSTTTFFLRAMRTNLVAAILGASIGLVAAQSPDPAAMAGQYAANAKQNATVMRQYSWQMRVEVTLKGEPKPAQLYQMRFDADGKPQKTLLSAPQEEPKGRGLRGRIKANKIEDFKEWAAKLAELVKNYMAPSPGTMLDFYAKAALSPSPDGTVQVSAGGFINPGDRAVYWLDKETKVPRRFVFETKLEGDAVKATAEFGQVQGGPQYVARLTIDVPAKKVSAKIENYNYQRQ
ncbi:MAG: hypothetical protein KA419_13095 [Acidobacteria bacterium]|nr:hypothetical protein [Acidobacteriota bacterium]